jgi:hypothetical protein
MNGSKWSNFLNSLATSGGNLFLLAFFSLLLLAVSVFLVVHYKPDAPAVTLVVGSFGTFTGALVGILRGSRVDTPPNTTVTTDTHTQTVPPEAK